MTRFFGIVNSIKTTRVYLLPRPQKATALALDECAYRRDVAPLSPAVREANRRNQVVSRACPFGSP